MKKLLLSAALGLIVAAPAYAGNIDVTAVSLPDGNAFNDVTTNGYGYYTGPITFTLSGGGSLTVYCADLNHVLQSTGTYAYVPLTINGLGNPISEATSNEIGQIAKLGFAALKAGGTAGLDEAVAAQAAIWDLEYGTTSSTADSIIAGDISSLLSATYANTGVRALAIDAVGEGWWKNAAASQQMVVGLSSVPELPTWAMGLMGFGLLGMAGLYRTRKPARYAL